jgi:ATP-dependent DNA helicase RecG
MLSDLSIDYELFLRANAYAKKIYEGKNPEDEKLKNEILSKIADSLNYICLN